MYSIDNLAQMFLSMSIDKDNSVQPDSEENNYNMGYDDGYDECHAAGYAAYNAFLANKQAQSKNQMDVSCHLVGK